MGGWTVYYVDRVKAPEEWISLSKELELMELQPIQLHTPEDAAKILKAICEENGSSIVVKLLGDIYAIPNVGILMIRENSESRESDDADFTTVKDMVLRRLRARDTEIIITSEKGFENLARDLFEGRIEVPDPWWKRKLKAVVVVLAVVALIVYLNLPIPKISAAQRFALRVGLLALLVLAGIRRGYFK
ncbi:hypothetical protein [Thermococcus aciditolerans]|uniref:Uncharacterized protein n=1 Tax=Thermococcus aciditolerans TaxID=2598455 RepID=A0A5C0SMD4_9EURY|nr:hypothetical protein [Thermococcus aciditolerans]QEK14039.1 hypothetical protein FPV09_01675 [Thermococcus aciditolerans]